MYLKYTHKLEKCYSVVKICVIYSLYMKGMTHYLIDYIKELDLPTADFAIFGSGPMIIHGLKEIHNDFDIIARGKAWEKIAKMGEVSVAPMGDKYVKLFNGRVECFDGWAPGDTNADALIDEAEMINNLPWVQLEHVLQYKYALNRPKDADDIRKIESYFEHMKELEGKEKKDS